MPRKSEVLSRLSCALSVHIIIQQAVSRAATLKLENIGLSVIRKLS